MKVIKQASLIAPLADNDGVSLQSLHGDLYDLFIANFGGFTSVAAYDVGILQSGKFKGDEVVVYTIAMEPSSKNADKLREIARYVCQRADQESVYIALADGYVEFIEEEPQL